MKITWCWAVIPRDSVC